MLLVLCTAIQSFALPTCSGSPATEEDKILSWKLCEGTYIPEIDIYKETMGLYDPKKIPLVDTYSGQWKSGLPDGEGSFTTSKGKIYSGIFKSGILTGKVGLRYYASELGGGRSLWIIGKIYEEGLGVRKDLRKAFERFTKAAENGSSNGGSALKRLRKKIEALAFDRCMFQNVNKVTNAQSDRIVKQYCQNQVAEKSVKELLPK